MRRFQNMSGKKECETAHVDNNNIGYVIIHLLFSDFILGKNCSEDSPVALILRLLLKPIEQSQLFLFASVTRIRRSETYNYMNRYG